MYPAKIVQAPKEDHGRFYTTRKNTEISQRETLEEIIVNLATLLEVKEIYKQLSARGNYFYKVQGSEVPFYQSASNTILELSRALSKKFSELNII